MSDIGGEGRSNALLKSWVGYFSGDVAYKDMYQGDVNGRNSTFTDLKMNRC